MLKLTRRRVIAAVTAAAVLVASAVVYANWAASGSGTVTASGSTAQSLTLTGSVSSALYPGGTANMSVTISNPNPYPVTVTTVGLTGGQSITTAATGCDASAVSFVASAGQGLSITVPAKSGATNGTSSPTTLTGALTMAGNAADQCQGASFQIPITVTGASS